MNETLQNAAAEAIKKGIAATEKGVDWLSGQIPDVVQQYLMWGMAKAGLGILLGIVILITTILLFRHLWKLHKKHPYDSWEVGAWMVASFGVFFSLITICPNIYTLVYIWVAPKVYLLEWAASFVKGN